MDYTATTTQLTFSISNSRVCTDISISEDSISEPMELFTVSLSFLDIPEGITIMPEAANVTIVDNDGKGRGGFSHQM